MKRIAAKDIKKGDIIGRVFYNFPQPMKAVTGREYAGYRVTSNIKGHELCIRKGRERCNLYIAPDSSIEEFIIIDSKDELALLDLSL